MRGFKLRYMKKNQKIITIIGPPGAGKGTQAESLANKLKFYSLETSKVLEESWKNVDKKEYKEINKKKFYFLKEKKLFDSGKLCSPLFVSFIIKKKIEKLYKQNKKIVFSGSPRTLYEGKKLMPFLINLYDLKNILVLNLKISDSEAISRNTKRRICSKCRHPIPYTPDTKNHKTCPRCGGKLFTRTIDTEKTMKIRLKEYKSRTYPLFGYLKKIGITIKKINGKQNIKDVSKDILKAVLSK